jgi:hypothetical protein
VIGDVDYLDPGDGSGIAAAIAALPVAGGDIAFRRGTYTLAAALSLPANSTLIGAGASSILVGTALIRHLLTVADDSFIQGFQLQLPDDAGVGAAGTNIVNLANRARARDLNFLLNGNAATVNESLTSIITTDAFSMGVSMMDLFIDSVLTPGIVGVQLLGDEHRLDGAYFFTMLGGGADPAVRVQGDRNMVDNVTGVSLSGFVIVGSSNQVRGSLQIAGGIGASLQAADRCLVQVAVVDFLGQGGPGIEIDANSDRNMIEGCSVRDYGTGVDIAVGATDNIVLGNEVDVTGVPINDLGTNTEVAHNRT